MTEEDMGKLRDLMLALESSDRVTGAGDAPVLRKALKFIEDRVSCYMCKCSLDLGNPEDQLAYCNECPRSEYLEEELEDE